MLGANELGGREQSGVVTQGPWMARDGYVAETSIKLDRLQSQVERLEHQGEIMKRHVSELMDNAHQAARFHSFAESLRNAREYKLDQVQRCLKDVKGRVEQIEGPRTAIANLTYKDLESVDRKLVALDGIEARVHAAERSARLAILLFAGSIAILAAAVAVRFY